MSPVRLLCPQQRKFERRCPLWPQFRLLHPQEQTFLVVSPKVRRDPKATFGIDRLTLRPDVISLSYTRVWEEPVPMAQERVQRRLAAILAGDIVGYRRAVE